MALSLGEMGFKVSSSTGLQAATLLRRSRRLPGAHPTGVS